MKILCPCDTGKLYSECCKIFHKGAYSVNALLLMRSRYSAYALSLPQYIIQTTHPMNPSYQQEHKQWFQEILYFCQNTTFQKLEILDFIDGNQEAYVTFNAHLIQNNLKRNLIEKSFFEKIDRQWLYRDGQFIY
jgi:SEC-C motif domain protein